MNFTKAASPVVPQQGFLKILIALVFALGAFSAAGADVSREGLVGEWKWIGKKTTDGTESLVLKLQPNGAYDFKLDTGNTYFGSTIHSGTWTLTGDLIVLTIKKLNNPDWDPKLNKEKYRIVSLGKSALVLKSVEEVKSILGERVWELKR